MMKLSTKCLLFAFFLLFILHVTAVTRTVQMINLERITSLDDYTCLTKDLIISVSVKDVSRCAFMCMEETECQTMFYNPQEGTCSGCTARYTPTNLPLRSPGFTHFQKEQQSCDDGWTRFLGSCYTLSPLGNLMDGGNYCETYNARPVYVETSEENDFLKNYLTSDTSTTFWYIGMTDSVQNGVWRYYGTNDLVTFLDFHPSEPTDGPRNAEQCAFLGVQTYLITSGLTISAHIWHRQSVRNLYRFQNMFLYEFAT